MMDSLMHRWILSLTIASIVILAGCAATAQQPPATTPPPLSDNATTPDAVVRDLYTYWTTFQGSPLAAQDAGRTPYFTETFLHQLDEQFATADGPLDPIVCALNTPERFVLESVTVDDTTATAIVQTYWAGGTEVREVRLRLLQTDQGWKVDGTDCQWPPSEDTTPPADAPPGSTLPLTTPTAHVAPTTWQPVTLNDEGLQITFEIPTTWQPGPGQQQWTPDPNSAQYLGIHWNDVPSDGSIEHALLPNQSETRYVQPLDLGWTTAQLYHVVRSVPAAAGGDRDAIEHHVIVTVDRQGTPHAYDLFVSAPTGEVLDAIYPTFQHMLDTFALDDSAISTPPTVGDVPGSTLPLDEPAADPADDNPSQTVRNFYSWYLTQANAPGMTDNDLLRPYHDGLYQDSPDLTNRLVRQINNRRLSPAPGDHDPLTCSVGYPQQFQPGAVQVSGNTASVEMQSSMPGHAVTVVLVREDGAWKIDAVECHQVGQ